MKNVFPNLDVIVVGAGHAGCESALATARLNCSTLLFTGNIETIALMPCNPAIGGPGKSQIVSEIDALGGEMGLAADATFIQMKILNRSRGPAVHSLRSQNDKTSYHLYMKNILENTPNLDIKQALIEDLIIENKKIIGVIDELGHKYFAKTVVITAGTFLNGKIHIGLKSFPAGRISEFPVKHLSEALIKNGHNLKRLKTGTPPRIDKRSIDFSVLPPQPGDDEFLNFSFKTKFNEKYKNQIPCYLTHTNEETHKIILDNLDRSPLYCGIIEGVGPRYCPSIEDKVVRFKERNSHHIFVEPEGLDTNEMYLQGLNTSLPEDTQEQMVHSMKGLEKAKIIKNGYAVEYDAIDSRDLNATLESKIIENLFFAGQINGTSGYEEAAGQGLIAGINSALKAQNKPPFILSRTESYLGTLIDDLIKKNITEPYRMMTSRSEYRLILRQDNAIFRLGEKGYELGLIKEAEIQEIRKIRNQIDELLKKWQNEKITSEAKEKYQITENIAITVFLNNTEITPKEMLEIKLIKKDELLIAKHAQIELKYQGYVARLNKEIETLQNYEQYHIPKNFDYEKIPHLKKESREKLKKYQPENILAAKAIAGINPVDLAILINYLRR